ncbi:MAG: HNH endonuclease [Epulopiscium sp. Nele67-Bin004]|nr:MAG: HNH endonuclease [Epulopiscium sp. Nele67-Bin004]
MLVYVLNKDGKPLMPCKPRKARKLLEEKKAKVVKREPFTIQLLYGSSGYKQEITLGVDAGSKNIGLSATTEKSELYSSEIQLRTDIVDLLSTRRQNRRTRRNRLRYRKPRFLNRVRSKNKGWLAPSIEHKIATHLRCIENAHKILPISKIIVEVASFDIQKIKNPDIQGIEYQQGEQLDFWNVREYVLFRDSHTCQCCKGKKKDKILNVHHIESRKTGGDAPNNLITLCETCHNGYHNGTVKLPKTIKRGMSFKDATFMGIMRWSFYNRLKLQYSNVSLTYGYITKNTRIQSGLEKSHRVDARCISGNPLAKSLECWYFVKQVRKNNRQIHKANILKGGKKKLNQAPYEVKEFRLFDKVEYVGKEGFIFGRRSTGYFDIRTLDGISIHKSASYRKLKLIGLRRSLLLERR